MNTTRFRPWLRWLLLIAVAWVGLQVFFLARIAVMARVSPESTTFERSEAWRIVSTKNRLPWRQDWVPYAQISNNLKRAVIASEDDIFAQHDGVQWDAIEKAWAKNAKAELQMSKKTQGKTAPKIVGGSTITQQLAKNLFLSGERTLVRKGQEFVLTLMLEAVLDNTRSWAELWVGEDTALKRAVAIRVLDHDDPRTPTVLAAARAAAALDDLVRDRYLPDAST